MESSQHSPIRKKVETLDDLPLKYRNVFQSYSSFNTVQAQALGYIFNSNNSIVIVAPTGSGKTVILELAIIKLLMELEETEYNKDFKVVYICPVKALCRERYHDWAPRFQTLGVTCVEITGDDGDYFSLQGFNLVITTPEKWDSLTRKWRDNASLVQLVKLFMIDEVHLLSDNQRGPVLEAIVCRMKTISATLKLESVRFVAISATIYNVEDLATWLGTKEAPAIYYKFGNEVRPVQLQKIVKGYYNPSNQSAFLFDIQLSYKLKTLILEYAKGKPSLIFCSTRKSVCQTSKILSEQLTFHFTESQLEYIKEGSSSISDNKLRELVLTGIGYHHAGLSVNDRHTVQNLFVSGSLPILVATSTLAMGVNLPAHLVVIKSTLQYKAGRVEEYPESSILQMIGRAGRPQFDTTAVAVIMTRCETVGKYERLLDSKETLESSLHLHLPEHLNSEIVLYTITDLSVAMEWIRCTFLYVRAIRNPRYYGFDNNANPSKVEKNLETICLKEINGLKRAELIEVSDNGMDISPTPNGRLMSHFYLSFETFKIFLQIKGTESLAEILSALSEAHEFSEVQLRVNERRILNELNRNKNRDHIRFQLPGKIKTRAMKVNCLIQSCLGCLSIQDPALYQESIRIVKTAERLAKCLSEFLTKKSHYQSMYNTVLLAKCLHAKLWDNSPFVCRQLERIGPTLGALLESCGKTSFTAIEKSNPRDLERILNRAPPFGNHLQEAVYHLPKYKITAETTRVNSITFQTNITVTLMNPDVIGKKNTAGDHHKIILIVGDTDNNLLSFNRFTDLVLIQKSVQVSVLSKFPNLPHKIIADVISEQWIGIDVNTEVIICPQAQTKPVHLTPGPPSKKKKKAEVNKKSVLPKEFEFLKNYRREMEVEKVKLPEQKNGVNDFVVCFDVDVEILEEPETNSEEVFRPMWSGQSVLPSYSLPQSLPQPSTSVTSFHSSQAASKSSLSFSVPTSQPLPSSSHSLHHSSPILSHLPSKHSLDSSYQRPQSSLLNSYLLPKPSYSSGLPVCFPPQPSVQTLESCISSSHSIHTSLPKFYPESLPYLDAHTQSISNLQHPSPKSSLYSLLPPFHSLSNSSLSQPESLIHSYSPPPFSQVSSRPSSEFSEFPSQPQSHSENMSLPHTTHSSPQTPVFSSHSPIQCSSVFSHKLFTPPSSKNSSSPPFPLEKHSSPPRYQSSQFYCQTETENSQLDSQSQSHQFFLHSPQKFSGQSNSSILSVHYLPNSSPPLPPSQPSFSSQLPFQSTYDSSHRFSNSSEFLPHISPTSLINPSHSPPQPSQSPFPISPEPSSFSSNIPSQFTSKSPHQLSNSPLCSQPTKKTIIIPLHSPSQSVQVQLPKPLETLSVEDFTTVEEIPKENSDQQETPKKSLITLEKIYEALARTKGYSTVSSNSVFRSNNEIKPYFSDSGYFSGCDSDFWKKCS